MGGETADGGLIEALQDALISVQTRPEDAATVKLAETYAAAIDGSTDAETLEKLGPKLLAALVELCMTPRARAAALKGVKPDGSDGSKRSALDELRDRRDRRARAHGTATVDPAS